ncbi:MAG: hypothetical protein ACO1RT_00725, partial [Planctomycetaceae bacterium]
MDLRHPAFLVGQLAHDWNCHRFDRVQFFLQGRQFVALLLQFWGDEAHVMILKSIYLGRSPLPLAHRK